MKVLGSDFYRNTIIEENGKKYRLVFDHCTKRTRKERIK